MKLFFQRFIVTSENLVGKIKRARITKLLISFVVTYFIILLNVEEKQICKPIFFITRQ